MAKISIKTADKKFPVAPYLYGLFFEDINRSGDSGLYPEMIRNRAFEDSIVPERCTLSEDGVTFTSPTGWIDQFNGGEGQTRWIENNGTERTPIPGWYAKDAEMILDEKDTLNDKRLASLDVKFTPGGSISNQGFIGVPQKKGEIYNFYMFAKAVSGRVKITASIESKDGEVYAQRDFVISPASFCRYDASFAAVCDDKDARFVLKAPCGGEVKFGFTSLMPADTYNGHGLRKDIMETLKGMNPKFLRFPGGCIVEGFTFETAMRFSKTIGPVWERPSHWLMWHYRTTNGLGYHEYLQLCEDLELEPMYVFNCGITCQARNADFFEGDELQGMLQEAIDAIEYATAPADSKWGKVRAAAGHPEPFKMTYVEIGNENHGEEYNVRYKMCYDDLKARFPWIKFVSNTHTEKDGLPTEIADEHFYSTTEFFAENMGMYDNYPRKEQGGPEIFVGEFAVNQGADGQLYAALGEAMFMCGMERNQDIVTLASYAPLLENVHYSSWAPNMVCFDNSDVYAIPTYYSWKLFGNHRGKDVVNFDVETAPVYRKVWGLPSIICPVGTRVKNPVFNGKAAAPYQSVVGFMNKEGDEYVVAPYELSQFDGDIRMTEMSQRPGFEEVVKNSMVILGDESGEKNVDGVFEVEIFAEEGKDIAIGMFTSRIPQSVYCIDAGFVTEKWGFMELEPFQWTISGGKSTITQGRRRNVKVYAPETDVDVKYNEFNTLRYETCASSVKVFLNGQLVQEAVLPNYPGIASVVTDTDDEVIVKVVNIMEKPEKVEISLDCDVQKDYLVNFFTGKPTDKNSLENPKNVCDQEVTLSGAAKEFAYEAPASSVSVLVLKKK